MLTTPTLVLARLVDSVQVPDQSGSKPLPGAKIGHVADAAESVIGNRDRLVTGEDSLVHPGPTPTPAHLSTTALVRILGRHLYRFSEDQELLAHLRRESGNGEDRLLVQAAREALFECSGRLRTLYRMADDRRKAL